MTRNPLIAALGLVVCALGSAKDVAATPLYRCRAIDGSVHMTTENMVSRFRAAMVSCTAVDGAAAVPAAAAAPLPDEVVVIARQRSPSAQKRPAGPRQRGNLRDLPHDLVDLVEDAAQRHRINPRLVQAVMLVESGYNQRARSPKGALGLMQLMPATAARFYAGPTSDLFDPAVNIDVGVRYLSVLADLFEDRLDLVLAAYNAGEGAVMRRGWRVPPFPETEAYVEKIMGLLSEEP